VSIRRYWFEFEIDRGDWQSPWSRLRAGCGVTGYDEEDCRAMIQERVLGGGELPPTRRAVADVDVSTLDPKHVLPNMGSVLARGIWFPQGYA
jgi:hypothetical protein